ncbi:TadE/TadG family type IV pilus assembly protein [Sinisalibacter lacisalsi]|uniref:Flp pilus-assembly TadG-like N-terminal domain-containing protein n=1 Tax=Sinisalibacter lacisalsi TaxID=1526570 RepID=A0ABQ1QJW0_9RHOB|nr:pilus assembly protein TadG-related protein [Sinisalibacter lacisalsi]GGD29837.1 hypothetical protein GCM10011358_12320 [Sinisalibacter lacisalsi]
MPVRFAKIARHLAANTKGGVAVIVALSLPVILGFGALALEYGAALGVKSENQRTSDIAAFAAAFAYKNTMSGEKAAAATAAAEAVASLNGVSSGITVSFDDPADATYVDVDISEDRPVYLSRLIRRNDSVTINTTSRVSLGDAGFTPCVLSLGDFKHDGFTVHGNAGTYNVTGCGIGSNGAFEATGVFIDTRCAAPSFNKSDACAEQTIQGGFTDPLADITNWPNDSTDDAVCDFTGSLLSDLSTNVGGEDYQLKPGVLCVSESSDKFDSVFSDPYGSGNTLIVKAGVHLKMSGGEQSFSVTPSTSGNFAGVGMYAPMSDVTTSGNASFSIDGLSCFGLVVNSMTFNGNVTLNAECDKDDINFGAGSNAGQPRLIR